MEKKSTIIHDDEKDLLFNPRMLKQNKKELHRFKLIITDEERKAFPEIVSINQNACRVYCEFSMIEQCIICKMDVKSKIKIMDQHDLKQKELLVSDSIDLSLSNDLELTDIASDPSGCFDLRPTALALFYSSIPNDYFESSLKSIKGDFYEVITEKEYLERQEDETKKANIENNPFAKLK